jgi:hypothetical protein
LRRIRHKRIQEELSQEGVYDDDAKSLSTVDAPAAPNAPGLQKRASWAPGDTLPSPAFDLPALTPPETLHSRVELPPKPMFNQYVSSIALFPQSSHNIVLTGNRKGPMLEALYYGLITPQTATTKLYADAYFTEWSTTMVNSSTTRSRRHSSPAVSPQQEIDEPSVYQPTRKRSSLPSMPPAPVIQPHRLPSVVDFGKSSWRLSFSAENRGDQLRKLSQGVNVPALPGPEKLVSGPQSMRKWLHSQGLRTASQAVKHSDDASNLECLASHSQTCASSQDFGGVDGGGDFATALHLHEMGISQRLASKGLQSSCSSPQLSSMGSRTHQRDVSSFSGISRATYKSRARRVQNTTDSLPLSERIPETWGNILENGNIQDGTSSFYPSANNSIQPSRKGSRFSLLSLLPGNKSKTDLTELNGKSGLPIHDLPDMKPLPSIFMSPTSPQTPLNRSSVPTSSASNDSLPLPLAGYHRRPTIDTNSTVISETESFREREAELSAVRTRFAAAEASRSPSTPRSSKFREEFDFSSVFKEEPLPSKLSALSRLTRFAARSFDGPFERKVGISMTPLNTAFEPDELQYHHHSKHAKGPLSPIASPLEDGSVLGLWGNAVNVHAHSKETDVASNLHIPVKNGQDARTKSNHNLRKKSHASKGSKEKRKKLALKGLGWGTKDSDRESEEENNPEDDWEAELAKVAQKAKGKSRNIVKRSTGPDRRYPASWSKFSSHDRHERTSSADGKDRIQVKDFAIDGSEFLGHNKKTLREKIQKRIVEEYDKYATAEVQNNTEGTFGRRSSMRPAGDLEYPELELLPLHAASLMSDEEIAEHVEEVLKEEELDRKEEELDAIFGLVKKVSPKSEIQPGNETKQSTGRKTPDRSVTIKTTGKGSRTESNAVKMEAKSSPEMPAKRGPTVRRGPVARKSGDEAQKQKPAPKIAPAVVMSARGRGAGKAIGLMDGSMYHGSENSIEAPISDSKFDDGDISIADPRFYDDCIVKTNPGPEDGLDDVNSRGSKKSKYRTWSSKDWDKIPDNFRSSAKKRRSLGTLKLRKSTDEILTELKKAEVDEREKALRAAEEAWGGW